MLRPWAEYGYTCWALDLDNKGKPPEQHKSGGIIHFIEADLLQDRWISWCEQKRSLILFGFPPCTDMAVSGAGHFLNKAIQNINFDEEAAHLARTVEFIGNVCGCPWFAENPVSTLATLWRKPDVIWEPYEYGGYLPYPDVHPRWPEYIPPYDNYPKKTCLWTGNGYVLPPKIPMPVVEGYSTQHTKLGGKSKKTKQIRSETPRGFALANFKYYNSIFRG